MKKTSIFTESKMDGKLNVTVTVIRTYGNEKEIANLDGDKFEVEKFRDDYDIIVKLEGAINAEVTCYRVGFAPDGKTRILDLGRIKINGSMKPVALTLACMDAILAACKEQLTEELTPSANAEIEEVKRAEYKGHVLPANTLKAKRNEYRNGMLEGGEGYNPYDCYLSEEYVNSIKSKYPNEF